MSKTFWEDKDFDVFQIDGLENRMTALIENVRPKFEELGIIIVIIFQAL